MSPSTGGRLDRVERETLAVRRLEPPRIERGVALREAAPDLDRADGCDQQAIGVYAPADRRQRGAGGTRGQVRENRERIHHVELDIRGERQVVGDMVRLAQRAADPVARAHLLHPRLRIAPIDARGIREPGQQPQHTPPAEAEIEHRLAGEARSGQPRRLIVDEAHELDRLAHQRPSRPTGPVALNILGRHVGQHA
jgi:hypothetical protein